jgi:hypothetical protein
LHSLLYLSAKKNRTCQPDGNIRSFGLINTIKIVDPKRISYLNIFYLMKAINYKTVSKIISAIILVAAVSYALFVIFRASSLIELSKVHFKPVYLLLSFLIAYAGTLLGAIPTWRQILAKNGVHQNLRKDISIYCYSVLGSILPGSIWNIAGRATLYQQLNDNGLTATLASILEAIIVGIAAFIIYTGSTIFDPRLSLWADRPWIGVCIVLASMFLVHPKIFQRMLSIFLRWVRPGKAFTIGSYQVSDLLRWLLYEVIVTIVGGIAIFMLLESILPVSTGLLIPVISAWAASVAVGTLFIWLPGSPVLRDGAMAIILAPFISTANAILFVIILRIWIIVSLLLLAGLVWLLLDRKTGNKSKV